MTVNSKNQTATVIYDEEQTDVQAIQAALKQGGYPPKGQPRFIDKN